MGIHAVGDTLHIAVPKDAQSVTFFSQAVSPAVDSFNYQGSSWDNVVIPLLLVGPGTPSPVYFDDRLAYPTDPSTAYAWILPDAPSTGAVTVPNTSAMLALSDGGLPSGTWQFTVNDYAFELAQQRSGTYDVQVIIKPGPASATGILDIAFYMVDGGISGASAVDDPRIQRMVKTLAGIYAEAGICVGTVTFYDVPQWAKDKYATGVNIDNDTAPCGDLKQLFTQSAPGNTLNFFLVPSLISSTDQPGYTTVGVDGTIPGPSSYGGTIASGAAVSMADLTWGTCSSAVDRTQCGADHVAFIAAHEGGHWLGLYHSTEATGDLFDPLADTGTCSCLHCTSKSSSCSGQPGVTYNSEHLMSVSECSKGTATCGGGGNLMFWLSSSSTTGLLSPEQGRVMRANALVH